jgi:hypothetical protein
MPLLVNSSLLTANNDILAYKYVKKEGNLIVSPYYRFYWEPGKIYHINKLTIVKELGTLCVNDGFHAYLAKTDQVQNGIIGLKTIRSIHEKDCIIAKMIIPKGSKYVLGYVGYIVSDSMILDTLL